MCDFLPHHPSHGKARSITIRPSIYLDYGVDGATSEDAACEICERGMRFRSQWHFAGNTLLNVAFAFDGDERQRVEAEALVIEVLREEGGSYLTTLAFIEAPPELRANLGKVSAHLVLPVEKAKPTPLSSVTPLERF